jgi:superfamily I DNA/RNA helicase
MNETWWRDAKELRDEQRAIVVLPRERSHLVTGPPGSGKTNLLLLRANYLYLAGHKNILVLVLTRTLQEFIAAGGANYKFPVQKVKTTRRWQLDFLREHNESVDVSGTFDEQRSRIIEKINSVVDNRHLGQLYDTILIDEAQDLLPTEIELFKKLSRHIFATADARQKIYAIPDSFPEVRKSIDDEHRLNYHYRIGREICRLADALQKGDPEHKPLCEFCNYDDAARPSSAELVQTENFGTQIEAALDALPSQLEAYPEELIGILCPSAEKTREIWDRIRNSEFGQIAVLQGGGENAPFRSETRLCVSTLHSAKGLEFRAVHVLGCEYLEASPYSRNLTYTAITRTKTSLKMYHSVKAPGFLEQAFEDMEIEHKTPGLDELFGRD